jgi:phosphoadenosine phosphosulfate reductase
MVPGGEGVNGGDLAAMNRSAEGLSSEEILDLALSQAQWGKLVLTTSFGAEDQVLTHFLAQRPVDIITLDTGRLFNETLETFDRTVQKYRKQIGVLFPAAEDVEAYVNARGPNAFYESVDFRKECCNIRKLKPLARGLNGYGVWITGLRAEQSGDRSAVKYFERDERFAVVKVNPLLRWTYAEVMGFIHEHDVPYNPLHDRGFLSIGCAPCTRAVREGEDFRAGRWWWEAAKKECGLHGS